MGRNEKIRNEDKRQEERNGGDGRSKERSGVKWEEGES